MLVNEEFKNEIKRTFRSSYEEAIIAGSDGSGWHIKEKSSLKDIDESEFFVLTMSSQLFRIFILMHFSKQGPTEQYVCDVLKINPSNLDDEKFYDYLGEVGNSFLGSVKRDIGRYVPSLGMSTPNRLNKNCLKTNYNWILEVDAGGSHQPKDLLGFLKFMNNKYDCIYGSRFCSGGKMMNSNFIRYFFSKGGSLISKVFFKIGVNDTTCGYQMFQRKIVK